MALDIPQRSACASLVVLATLCGPTPGAGQQPSTDGRLAELTSTPEATTTLFLRSVRAIQWDVAAQFIHPETLERFHTVVTMISDADSTGAQRRFFTQSDSVEYRTLGAATVFDRAIGTVIDGMPGLMHSIFDRDDEVIGGVPEGPEAAHVVYRTTARISGAVPEVKVMQLRRGEDGWRVLWSDELEVLEEALRGAARGRRPPPGVGDARSLRPAP